MIGLNPAGWTRTRSLAVLTIEFCKGGGRGLHQTESDVDDLVRHRGRIVSRKEILEQVWRVHEDTDTRAIDNFMVRLRRYLEDEPSEPKYLQTVRGVGYRFLPDQLGS